MLIYLQASSPWWSSLLCALWCLWYGTCSATKAPTTPMRPRAPTRQIVPMQRLLLVTQPSLKPLRRARRSGSSDWLLASETRHAGMDTWEKQREFTSEAVFGTHEQFIPKLYGQRTPWQCSMGLKAQSAVSFNFSFIYSGQCDGRTTFKQIIENSRLWMNVLLI